MNYRRGIFRLWLIFAILWSVYFGWLGVTTYNNAPRAQARGETWNRMASDALSNAKEPPFAGGRNYYEAKAEQFRAEATEAFKDRDEYIDQLEIAYTYGPAVPIALLLLFPIATFVTRGFKSDDSLSRMMSESAGSSEDAAHSSSSAEKAPFRFWHRIRWAYVMWAAFAVLASAVNYLRSPDRFLEVLTSTLVQAIGIALIAWVVMRLRKKRRAS